MRVQQAVLARLLVRLRLETASLRLRIVRGILAALAKVDVVVVVKVLFQEMGLKMDASIGVVSDSEFTEYAPGAESGCSLLASMRSDVLGSHVRCQVIPTKRRTRMVSERLLLRSRPKLSSRIIRRTFEIGGAPFPSYLFYVFELKVSTFDLPGNWRAAHSLFALQEQVR